MKIYTRIRYVGYILVALWVLFGQDEYVRLRFQDLTLQSILGTLTPLLAIAVFLERALEVLDRSEKNASALDEVENNLARALKRAALPGRTGARVPAEGQRALLQRGRSRQVGGDHRNRETRRLRTCRFIEYEAVTCTTRSSERGSCTEKTRWC